MRVNLIPLYPRWGASSRLRVHTLEDSLRELGHQTNVDNPDVALIQKRAPAEHPPGKLVVFDCDDLECYDRVPEWIDLVTTDTEGHAEGLKGHTSKPVEVVPDPIDYCPEAPLPPTTGQGVVWFGHYLNYHSVQDKLRGLAILGTQVRIITHKEHLEDESKYGIEVVPWALNTFVGELRKSEWTILSHEGADPGKSNNKLITAITLGMEYEVSDTPEYSMVVWATKFMTADEAQRWVWERYHPLVIAERWLEVVTKYL